METENNKFDHSFRFQTDILTLLKEGVMSGEDLIEDYVEIYSGLRDDLGRVAEQSEIPGTIYTRFLKDWHRRMKVPRLDWVKQIVPRALFSLSWGYARTSVVLGISESKIRFYALQALQEKIGTFPKHLGKDCARNDIYLVDVLMGQSWNDSLKIYRPEEFRAHLKDCPRCSQIYSSARSVVDGWKSAAIRAVPAEIDMILKSQPPTYGSGFLSFYHRLGWANKLGLQIMGSALVLAAVLLVPFYQKIDIGRYFRGNHALNVAKSGAELPSTDEPVSTEYGNDKLAMNKAGTDAGEEDLEGDDAQETASSAPAQKKAEVVAAAATPTPAPVPEKEKPVLTKILPLKPVEMAKNEALALAKLAPKPVPTPAVLPPHPAILPLMPSSMKSSPVVVAKVEAPKAPPAPQPEVVDHHEPVKTPDEAKSSTAHVVAQESLKSNGKHYFYRWGARSDDPDSVAPGIMKTISKYKAAKAGELDLGAEYKGGRYFHFTIDKTGYEELISEIREVHLQDFSATRSESDRDDGAGKIRIVFWVGPTKL